MRLVVDRPSIERNGAHTTVSTDFHIGSRTINLWYRAPTKYVDTSQATNAFLAATLIPSMNIGCDLVVHGAVSERLLSSIDEIQDIITAWYPGKFRRIEVTASDATTPKAQPRLDQRRSASFFSGGVDSFYTVFKHDHEVSDIFYVHGFDLFLDAVDERAAVSERLNKAAKAFGKNLIEVETNIHDFSKEFTSWPPHYHGSALASMAMLFSKQFSKFYFASTHSYADMFPWGSHPLLDPLWSTERVQIAHDGAESTRVQKVQSILAHDIRVLDYLNVGCVGSRCRRTEKCLRTMISLDLAGVLDRAKTFNHPLELSDIANMHINGANDLAFEMENLRELKERPDKRPVLIALKKAINRYQHRQLARTLKQYGRSFFASDDFAKVRPEIERYLPGTGGRRPHSTSVRRGRLRKLLRGRS